MAAKKTVTRKTTVVADAGDVAEARPGMNIDDGIVLTTFLALAAAVTFLILALGTYPR